MMITAGRYFGFYSVAGVELSTPMGRAMRLAGFVGLILMSCMISGLLAPVASAQSLNNAFGGFATDSNEPINIESDSLEVNDAKKTAIFRGNVVAVRGEMEMRTPELEVYYSGQVAGGATGGGPAGGGASAGPGGKGSQLTRLRAKKKVLITSNNSQTAKSDWADFDVVEQKITIGGNVVVSQGKNIMKGEKLIIDLKTGESRFETTANSKTRGRVTGVFHPSKKPGKKAGAKPKPGAQKKQFKPTIVDGWSTTN